MLVPSRHDEHETAHVHQRHPPEAPGTDALKDPVCGMAVTELAEHHTEHEGQPYYFCSAKCLAKFSADPSRYLQPAPPALALAPAEVPAGSIYTCPMHPEIRQDHPGNCPKCGMTLEPILP